MRLTESQIRRIVRGIIREQTDDENEQLVDQPQEMMSNAPRRRDIPSLLPRVDVKDWESLQKSSKAMESAIEVTIERYYAEDPVLVQKVQSALASLNYYDEHYPGHEDGEGPNIGALLAAAPGEDEVPLFAQQPIIPLEMSAAYDDLSDLRDDVAYYIREKIDSGEGGLLGRLANLIRTLVDRSTRSKYEITSDGIANLIVDVIMDKVHLENLPGLAPGMPTIGGQVAMWIDSIGQYDDVGYVVPKQITGPTSSEG
jgi:hypothetical protein